MFSIEMFEQIASAAVAMLIMTFLISIAFIMVYGWFVRGEVKASRNHKSSSHKKTRNLDSSERYTIFHSLYEAMKEKEDK